MMLCFARYSQELAYRYVPDLDDLIFLFFLGGIYETRGRSATCSGFVSRFSLLTIYISGMYLSTCT